jgi:hypothetical protein
MDTCDGALRQAKDQGRREGVCRDPLVVSNGSRNPDIRKPDIGHWSPPTRVSSRNGVPHLWGSGRLCRKHHTCEEYISPDYVSPRAS